MAITNATNELKTVASPNASYESLVPLWKRSRAVCSGERYVKALDGVVRVTNMLIPFSPSMDQAQYNFYKAEAELPGITAQFARMIVGGLLRKSPTLDLPDEVPDEAHDWIMDNFGQDDSPIVAFMDEALWEEAQTKQSWIHVDYPNIENTDNLTREDVKDIKPYPVLWDAESVINWRVGVDELGKNVLNRVIKRGFVESYEKNEFHPEYLEHVWVHELDASGYYQVRVFERSDATEQVVFVNGREVKQKVNSPIFEEKKTMTNIKMNGERLKRLPIWPLNGSFIPSEPLLMPIIDKEVSLYNKVSRRNHLLYGAATYTPVIKSDMNDDEFQAIVDAGLGSWIHVGIDEDVDVLKTPTEALQDMEKAIASAIEEMAKMGIRMLTPETAQSGVALEIRNAAQTAQLGTFNTKVSDVLSQIITFMLNWRYNLELKVSDINFSLSADFNPVPLGSDWMTLVTDWYREGLIPRSIWLEICKHNDLMPPDYNDEEGKKEINDDEFVIPRGDDEVAKTLEEG